jgi:hypothetical protein
MSQLFLLGAENIEAHTILDQKVSNSHHEKSQYSGWYQTPWYSGQHSCFVFGRSRSQISAPRPDILTEVLRGFPQSLYKKYLDGIL